jgi:hypothetical protein
MIDEETQGDSAASAGAPVNRDARREPEVIEGEVAARETGESEPRPDPTAAENSAEPGSAAPAAAPRTGGRGFLGGALAGLIVSALAAGAGYTLLAPKADVSENANRLSEIEAQARRDNSALAADANRDRAAMSALEKRIGALEAGTGTPAPGAADLEKRVGALEAAAGASNAEELNNRVAALEAGARSSNTTDLDKRIAALEAANAGNSAASDATQRLAAQEKDLRADIDAARGEIPDLSARIAKLETDSQKINAATADLAALAARVDKIETALAVRVDKIETALAAPKTDTRAAFDNATAIAIVTETAENRLRAGLPLAPDLAALQHLGIDAAMLAPLQAVANGAPTNAALAASFSAVAPKVLAAAAPGEQGTVTERFLAHLHSLVRVRDLNETAGEDPPALVSQIEAETRRGDIRGALASFDKLPEAARQAAGPKK